MSKGKRFLIVLLVLGVSFSFLWPTIRWYYIVPQEDKALALGTREQIRDYSIRMANRDIAALKAIALSESKDAIPADYAYLVEEAKRLNKVAGRAAPQVWTVGEVFKAFTTEGELVEVVEAKYSKRILDLKDLNNDAIKLGLDLSGGMSVVIQADMKALATRLGHEPSTQERDEQINLALEVLNSRIDRFGLTEPVIRRQGDDQIYIEIPGAADPEKIKSVIMGKGKLAFHIVDDEATNAFLSFAQSKGIPTNAYNANINELLEPNTIPVDTVVRGFFQKDKYGIDKFDKYLAVKKEAGLDGNHIKSAEVVSSQLSSQPEINFQLDAEGGEIFYKLTSANIKKTMAIVLDDRIKAGATIQDSIRDQVRMSGFAYDEAIAISTLLKTASLPVELEVVNQQAVGASLGEDAIRQGTYAVFWGLLAVLLFMWMYYKGAGINAMVAQLLNMYIMLGVLSAFNLTLTLPSIAGFVLTIGMAVDANVIIFERIKEEMRLGKTRAAAIAAGFDKAFWAIMDSNITTIIAAIFMAQLGSGPIQGFAISLAIGNFSSLFTALFVSKLMFDTGTELFKQKKVSISWRIK